MGDHRGHIKMRPPRQRALSVFFALILIAAFYSQAQGHAFPVRSDPRLGWVIANSPPKVTIWFDSDIEGAFSKIEVYDSAKQRVDKNDPRVDPANRNKLEVTLSPLPPGTYHVHWTVLSVDTHVTEGAFMFTVGR